jgi:hypothetical protein
MFIGRDPDLGIQKSWSLIRILIPPQTLLGRYVSSYRKKKVHRRNGHDYGMVGYNTALSRISN